MKGAFRAASRRQKSKSSPIVIGVTAKETNSRSTGPAWSVSNKKDERTECQTAQPAANAGLPTNPGDPSNLRVQKTMGLPPVHEDWTPGEWRLEPGKQGLDPRCTEIMVVEWVLGRNSTLHSQRTTLALISPRQEDQVGPVWFNQVVDSIPCVQIDPENYLLNRVNQGALCSASISCWQPYCRGYELFWRFPILTWLSLVGLCVVDGDLHDEIPSDLLSLPNLWNILNFIPTRIQSYCSYSIVATFPCHDTCRFWIR